MISHTFTDFSIKVLFQAGTLYLASLLFICMIWEPIYIKDPWQFEKKEPAVSLFSWGLCTQQNNPRDPEHPLCAASRSSLLSSSQQPNHHHVKLKYCQIQPDECGESGRLCSVGQSSKRNLGQDQDGEWKELEGMKSKSQLKKYLQHDQRMRGWEKENGWILSRCIWRVFAIKREKFGINTAKHD